MNGRMGDRRWDGYVGAFHTERPGITEAVLAGTSDGDGKNPYDWVAEALPRDGTVIDLGCGSGPLAARAGRRWIGIDRNPAELALATRAAPGRVVRADATAVALRAGNADAAVCSMALMVFDDPGRAVAEMARLLRAGGLLVAMVPALAPLTLRDRARYARLLAALRRPTVPFPRYHVVWNPRPLVTRAGLTLVSAERRRFAYPLTNRDDALRWLRSLYLPGVEPRRWRAAQRVTQQWIGSNIGIPVRRLVATKNP